MADALHETDAPPPVPGFWRLGWLLFMQPLTLHRLFAAWGLQGDPSLWALRGRLKDGDPVVRMLLARLGGWLLLVMPVSTLAVAGSLALTGLPLNWGRIVGGVAFGVAAGIALGIAFSVAFGVANGVVFGFTMSIAGGLSAAIPESIAIGIAGGVTVGALVSTLVGVSHLIFNRYVVGIAGGIVIGILFGVVSGIVFGVAGGPAAGVVAGFAGATAFSITFFLTLLRLPLYLTELTLIGTLRLIGRFYPASLPRLASYLPYRHHELIYLPLPLLAGFLVRLGEEDPAKGFQPLLEAFVSMGQKGPAQRAMVELQARFLEWAARERRYASAANLVLPYLPVREILSLQGLPKGEPTSTQPDYLAIVESIAAAARDLDAARSTGSYHRRRQALTRARKELERILGRLTAIRRLTRDERRFLPVVKSWLDRVEDEEAALAALERESPQVPLVFVAGVPLTPEDQSLFVGRSDLVRLLDQDLAAERPVPLVLLGQRRMGKSTLLNFLPRLLGTGTRVVRLDFQGLSGHPLRREPYRWVAAEVETALAGEIEATPAPQERTPWGATLDWLAALEKPLAASDRRLLIALDEVEGLERGIREKWSDPAFLDFLRAAGDRLRRIRFLLVTAHPFSRLGPHWSDRLISAQTRRIEPLAEKEARALLTQPVDGFPDIYPPGGVERLLIETACHPYLLQLTAYHLTRRLNDAGRLKATDDDVTAALDQALEENNLFQYLWDDLSATEQRLVAALARGEEPAGEAAEALSQARRKLASEQLIQRSGDGEGWRVAVPLFARWIREIGAAG